jgi:restriction endonuclease S subunit
VQDYEIVKWAITGIIGIIVWFLKRTIDKQDSRIDSLDKEQRTFREDYLHKNDFKDFKIEIRGMFEEIKTDIRELKK